MHLFEENIGSRAGWIRLAHLRISMGGSINLKVFAPEVDGSACVAMILKAETRSGNPI